MGERVHRLLLPVLLGVGICASFVNAYATCSLAHLAYALLFGATLAGQFLYKQQQTRLHRGIEKITGLKLSAFDPASITAVVQKIDLLIRKGEALLPEVIDAAVEGSQGRSHAFNRIVETAMKQLQCESAEIALIDKTDGRYHSSIVIGRPFRETIDEYLTNQRHDDQRELYLEPILFAGTVQGAIRVNLKADAELGDDARKILKAFALQAAVAIVNADFLNEILKMRETSHASQKARTGFLANLSHELRGPLGIVLNAAELLSEGICGPLNDDQKETLAMIQKNGSYLLELLTDVLDFAKIESGKVVPQPVSMLAHELLLDLASVVRAQADAKQHKIIVEECDEDLHIFSDRRHIRQILINLLTNAIKYTPEGGEIRLSARTARGGKVQISVKDTGVGIGEDDRDKVFAAFERIDHSYSRKQMGSGLGMSLSRKLAELNHGGMDFESTPKQGSHFWVTMPFTKDASTEKSETGQTEKIMGGSRSILVISAAQEENVILTRYLTDHQFNVTSVSSVHDALRSMKGKTFSAVLLDDSVLLDYASNTIGSIRDEMIGMATPLVLMSGEAFHFNVEDNLRAGVDRHITKPISLGEVARVCLELSKSEERLVQQNKKREPKPVVH